MRVPAREPEELGVGERALVAADGRRRGSTVCEPGVEEVRGEVQARGKRHGKQITLDSSMAVHALATMTWSDVRALANARTVAVLPAGAIEAHGPHLPLGTDIVIAEAMARAGAERLSARGFDVLLLPALAYAPAPFAASFAGTIHTSPEATTMMVRGIARSLAAHGVRATAIANAHHDPAHVTALRTAAAEVAADDDVIIVFPDLTRRRWAARLTDEFRSGACHAGRYEGSIVLAEHPENVKTSLMQQLRPNVRSLVDAIHAGRSTFVEAGGPDAFFGYPAEASADEGRATIAVLGAILEEAVLEALGEPH
jgi:creatinine amidohydrolase